MPSRQAVARRRPTVNDPSVAKKLLVAGVIAVLAAGVGWALLSRSAESVLAAAKSGIERWCGTQLLALAAEHLNPTLHFDTLVYTYPKTVTLTGVRLAEQEIVVISAESITIEFAGIPRAGEPLVFETLYLRTPMVRLIEQPDGSLLGLTDLVKSGKGSPRDDGGSTRLSDVLAITMIRIADGHLRYEPSGKPAMVLRPLTFDLRRGQRVATERDPGWYAFEASLTLEPGAELVMSARVNLDTGDLDVARLTLDAALSPARYQEFPPQIQQFLEQNQVVGTLHGSMDGLVGLGNAGRTSLGFHVTLTDARAVVKDYEIPIRRLDLDGTFSENVLELRQVVANAFNGRVELSARFDFSATGDPFEIHLRGDGLRLEDTMHYEGKPNTDYTGDVTVAATVSGRMDDLPMSLAGGGDLSVTNGRIVLVDLFRAVIKSKSDHSHTDRAELIFEVHGDRLHFSKVLVLGTLIGIRGDGDQYYDGRLNFVVSAGPIERLTGDMGPIGGLLGAVAGSLVKYQVTGSIDDTTIRVLPFGLGEKK